MLRLSALSIAALPFLLSTHPITMSGWELNRESSVTFAISACHPVCINILQRLTSISAFGCPTVKQRAKLSRLGVETASNSFHLGMQPSGILAGGIWSVLHGHYLRDSQAAFSTEANDHSNCPRIS